MRRTINESEIEAIELTSRLEDEEARSRIIEQDEEIVYDDIVWDQQNARLQRDKISLSDQEKKMIISLNSNVTLSNIAQNEKRKLESIKRKFYRLCKKLCVENQKEALRRARDLDLL